MSSCTHPTQRRTSDFARRLSATAAIGALLGLPLAMPASAADPSIVTFTGGGLGMLLCGSKPDTSWISVPAEQRVRLTNELGIDATLNIDGSANSAVANGETVEIQFHRGPVTIGMVPDCPLNLNPTYEQLTVDVQSNSAVDPAVGTTAPRPSAKSSTKPSTNPSPANAGPIRGGADGSPPVPSASGTPLFSDPALPGADSSAGANLDPPATVVTGRGARGQKLAGDTGPVDKGPIGLLAIIATVCVVGVSAGAIRAIITQRATRTEFA